MGTLRTDQLRHTLSQIWAWWKKDVNILVENDPTGPRCWYLVTPVVVLLGEWFAGIAEG